jgi:hypothetical protein
VNANPLPIRHAVSWGLAAFVISFVFSAVVQPTIAPSSDVWDYAQEARQLARGEGFTSLYTYPVHLGRDERPPFPVRWRMPLYAARGALSIQSGVSLPNGFLIAGAQAHGLLVALVFLLAAHLHSARAGAIAAAVALACPLFLDAYHPALSQAPAAVLGLLVWLVLLRGKGTVTALLAAVPAAAAWYLRGESLLMAPLWIWAAAARGGSRPGWARGAIFAAAYAALCAPWPIFLLTSTGSASSIHGNPMLLYTPEFPGYSSARAYGEALPGVLEYLLRHPLTFAIRFVKDAAGYGLDLLSGLGPIAVGLFMAGLLLREAKERYAPLKPAIPFVIAIAIQVAAFSALERSPRFLVPVAPLACVIVGMAAVPVLDRLCGRRMVAALFALLLLERLLTVGFQTREAPRRFPPLPKETTAALTPRAEEWPKTALVLTDVPDWTAWHLDRPALLLPLWRDLNAVRRDHEVAAIFLSPGARGRNAADGDTAWVEVIDRAEPIAGFSGPEALPGGSRLYVRE